MIYRIFQMWRCIEVVLLKKANESQIFDLQVQFKQLLIMFAHFLAEITACHEGLGWCIHQKVRHNHIQE